MHGAGFNMHAVEEALQYHPQLRMGTGERSRSQAPPPLSPSPLATAEQPSAHQCLLPLYIQHSCAANGQPACLRLPASFTATKSRYQTAVSQRKLAHGRAEHPKSGSIRAISYLVPMLSHVVSSSLAV